jgi:O-antigen ligase
LGLLTASLCLAIVTARNMGTHRFFEVASCIASFYAGYLLWRRATDADQLAWWLIALSLAYVAICLIALTGLDPAHFPVINHYWSQDGFAQARPMVTADSNMQIYYLFPAALVLALPFKPLQIAVTAATVLGGLYILAQLQTRSGALVYGGIVMLTLLAPLWNRELGRSKMLLYPAAAVATCVIFWPTVQHASELLLYRLQEADMASGNGRVESTLFALNHLFEPYWWIPRGADEFLQRYGGLPHSNLTAIYLDGGLIGLIAWVAIVIAPIFQGSRMLLQRRLDAPAIMALIAAIAVLLVQLSLHNPMRDQIWLWAGALIGVIARLKAVPAQPVMTSPPPLQDAPEAIDIAGGLRIGPSGIINPPRA